MTSDTPGRLLRLLGLLQARREWSGAELAERLGVTDRTVRRDMGRLRDLGYPVTGTTGTAGGYRLASGKDLPPLLLDDEEAVAVAAALLTAGNVMGIEETAARALTKLQRVLPTRLRPRIAALATATDPLPPPAPAPDAHRPGALPSSSATPSPSTGAVWSPAAEPRAATRPRSAEANAHRPGASPSSDPAALPAAGAVSSSAAIRPDAAFSDGGVPRGGGVSPDVTRYGGFAGSGAGRGGPRVDAAVPAVLAEARRDREVVAFGYRDRSGRASARRVEPYGLVVAEGRWCLVAYDLGRGDWRTFRLERMDAVTATGRRFVPRPLPAPDAATFVLRALASAPYRYRARAVVRADAAAVAARLPGPVPGTIEGLGDGTCAVRLRSDDADLISAHLVALGPDVTVEPSPALRDHLRRVADRLRTASG